MRGNRNRSWGSSSACCRPWERTSSMYSNVRAKPSIVDCAKSSMPAVGLRARPTRPLPAPLTRPRIPCVCTPSIGCESNPATPSTIPRPKPSAP
eukprot:scaffold249325_cov30-Tisochrysis_lutea.AAC.15